MRGLFYVLSSGASEQQAHRPAAEFHEKNCSQNNRERKDMETEERGTVERLESATTLLEKVLHLLEERCGTGDVERISATVESTRREDELAEKLNAAEQELSALRNPTTALSSLRKTIPSATSEMLAKHGIGEGPVDVRTLDAALAGLSLEQRIAVKSQLLRAGAIA